MGGQFDSKPDVKAWLLLIFLSLIWGTSFILIKRGLIVFSSGEVGALRIAMAGVFLSPIAVINLNQTSKKDWLKLLLIGMTGTFIPSFLFAIAQTKLDSGLTGVFTALTPMWVLLIGVVFFGQHMRWRRNIGLLIGLLGAVLLILSGSQGRFQNINYYALFVIVATFLYGINVNFIKYYLGHIKATIITSISVLFVSPMAVFYLFVNTDFVNKMEMHPGFWMAFFYISLLGIFGTAIALIIFNNLVQMTTPIFTSSVTYLIPIVAIVWAVIDGESLFAIHYFAIVSILVGVYLVNRSESTSA